MVRNFLFILFFSVLVSNSLIAQRYYGLSKEEFGKSKVQNKNLQWRSFSSANFDYNFYRGGENIAKNAANLLEKSNSRIIDIVGYSAYDRIGIFIFNSQADLNASNLGGDPSKFENGTFVDTKNGRILVAYQKNDSLFNRTLVSKVVEVYMHELLYGGSVKESIENQILLNVPAWFSQGLAAFVAEENNSAQFSNFKRAISESQNQRLNTIKGENATLIGQSIWHYIALRYGKDNISNILNLTRIIHDEQSSITSSLGISFSRFLKEWKDFYILGPVNNVEEEAPQISIKEEPRKYLELKEGEIDTENYVFNPENLEKFKANFKNTPNVGKPGESVFFKTGDPKFSSIKLFKNFLVLNEKKLGIAVDPVRNFGLTYNLSMSDMLQNNVFRFDSYFRPSTPLFRSYDYSFSYGNYSKKIDFIFQYDKRSINLETVDSKEAHLFRPLNKIIYEDSPEYLGKRVVGQTLSLALIYPFSDVLKVVLKPTFYKNDIIDYTLSSPENVKSDYFFVPSLSLVFDNTKRSLLGVETGTKAKVSLDKFSNFGNELKNFQNINVDLRHHQRITKGLLASGRFNYGKSKGNSPQFTFLGGTENNINRSVYQTEEVYRNGSSDLRTMLFYNFPGNLRGFDFGRLFGNNHLLGNLELKSPLGEFLPQMALNSNFVRNLSLVGFFDVGTAWIGDKGPFSRQNSVNTVVTGEGSPFVTEVTNFKNPFLYGVGGGIRTSILGIQVRLDYAHGIEDKEIQKAKFHFSIGKDF